jgi:DNA polymerase-4/DNA polymerase V
MSVSTNNPLITLHSYPRAIVHVDCDAFFTSCEEARSPALRGKPLVTGQERGIVSCANYVAKARGVQRPMRLFEAQRACPGLIVLPSDYELYSIYSERVFAVIRRFTPDVEEYSIDEAFCDITGLRRLYRASYPEIAMRIKEAIQAELGITVSAGLSCSKTLAKICSKENKPDGFLAVPGNRLHEFLKNVPLARVCGFGPNTVELLTKCGIRNVLDYVLRPAAFCQKLLGKTGVELWQELRGVPVYPLATKPKTKYLSISKTKTFMPASSDQAFVKAQLLRNLESACIKLRRYVLGARRVAVYLRRQDFSHAGMEARITRHSSSALDFSAVCARMFDEIFRPDELYRSTGVVLSDIKAQGTDERDLFDDSARVEGVQRLDRAIDALNGSYGKHTVHLASTLMKKNQGHQRSTVVWRKQELLKAETFRRRVGIPLLKLK